MFVLAMALCIPYFHEPLIRFAVISKSEREHEQGHHRDDEDEMVVYISKASMLIGCVILAVLRIMIPLFILVVPLPRRDASEGRVWRIR